MFSNIKNNLIKLFKNAQFFLFNNVSTRQTVAKNFFWLAIADGVNKILKLILFFYIARIFGATEYGKFSFALGFVGLFVIISDLTVSKIVTREFAKNQKNEEDFPSVLSLETLLSFITLLVIFVVSFFVTVDSGVRYLIWLVGVYFIISIFPEIFYSFFRARQKMEYQAWSNIVTSVVTTCSVLGVIFFVPSIVNLSLGYLFSATVSLLFVLLFFRYKVSKLKMTFDFSIWKKYLSISWPLVLAGLVQSFFSNFDLTYMGHLSQYTETGFYSAAQKVVSAVLIPVGFITITFYPLLSKMWAESKEALQEIFNYYFVLVLFLALPILVGGLVLAKKIVYLVYGPVFDPSIVIFQWLLFSGILAVVAIPCRNVIVVANKLKSNLLFNFIGALINILINIFLIKKYSFYGAVAANLLTNLFFLVTFFVAARKYSSLSLYNYKVGINLIFVLISSLLMYVIISLPTVYNLNVMLVILVGFITYVFGYFFLKLLQINLTKYFGTRI
jgi:O-antigen/teichoic acid export membrane protein